jgi:hypothetical protein
MKEVLQWIIFGPVILVMFLFNIVWVNVFKKDPVGK